MKRYIIDTNALISFVTDRNLEQQKMVTPIFEAAARLKCSLICHQSVLSEFVFVMDKVYGLPKERINTMLADFIAMPGVVIEQQTDFKAVLALWPTVVADYGDALVAATAKAVKGGVVVSFDAKFKTALKKMGLDSI